MTDEAYGLLVRAAAGSADDARRAWSRWQALVDLDDVDARSFPLLPQVYANLVAAGEPPEALARLRNVHRFAWLQRQVLTDALGDLRGALADAGVPTLAVGGASRARYYGDGGGRLFEDAGALVATADAPRAVETLRGAGWTSIGAPIRSFARRRFAAFERPERVVLRLHWRLYGPGHGGDDSDAWSRAEDGALGPADDLAHTVAHGVVGGLPASPWPVDVAVIVRNGRVDWDAFGRIVAERRLQVHAAKGLGYVGALVDLDVPAPFTDGRRSTPERLRFWWERQWTAAPWIVAARRARDVIGARRPNGGVPASAE